MGLPEHVYPVPHCAALVHEQLRPLVVLGVEVPGHARVPALGPHMQAPVDGIIEDCAGRQLTDALTTQTARRAPPPPPIQIGWVLLLVTTS
ncbi:MAG: hypothetical protein ACLQAT_18145 [Candidatus Binataceae bacterium]